MPVNCTSLNSVLLNSVFYLDCRCVCWLQMMSQCVSHHPITPRPSKQLCYVLVPMYLLYTDGGSVSLYFALGFHTMLSLLIGRTQYGTSVIMV